MLFNSLTFVIFFVLVFGVYHLLGRWFRVQNLFLLIASCIFYGWWDARFLHLFVFTISLDYCCGLIIGRGHLDWKQGLKAALGLLLSAIVCLGINWPAVQRGGLGALRGLSSGRLFATGRFEQIAFVVTLALIAIGYIYFPILNRLGPEQRRRAGLITSIVGNLVVLAFFKYFNFFADSFAGAWQGMFGVRPDFFTLNVVLPVGISFYTFQTMGYTIDVYRRQMAASESFVEFGGFLAFFPHLVAGPIQRSSGLLLQFREPRPRLTTTAAREAAWLITWGLYKKMVVADNMGRLVNETFGPFDKMLTSVSTPQDGLRLLFALYAFAFQIYGDFSGYTDIARGTAKLLGFDIMINFNLPYFATSPSSFWRRWHISLSTWLRDYLYIGLGGNRGGPIATYRNLFLTMLLGGLWHGASWTFVLWGAYHGILLIIYRVFGMRTERQDNPWFVNALLGVLMFHLTCLGWLLFRARNLATVGIFLQAIFLHPHGSPKAWEAGASVLYYCWFLVLFQVIQAVTKTLDPMPRLPWFVRLNIWIFVVMSLLALSVTNSQEFIYFDF